MHKRSDQKRILTEIAIAEKQLATLHNQQREIETTLQLLKSQLKNSTDLGEINPTKNSNHSYTRKEKVNLFQTLFRGRKDIYPKLWINNKTGKKGYAPACANEWKRGICKKPKVRCGECPSQAFLSVSYDTILAHLQGHHVIGVYPMLSDETCWFLAADFDKEYWQKDVLAFSHTCLKFDIPHAIERSRSGNGGHVWFFFDTPITAVTARKLGSFLITETMSSHHELSMSSYDRLFPNQDTLPKGGFGNLIALPLQYHSRKSGHTEFLDNHLNPLLDQWKYLASIQKISPTKVNEIVRGAERQGKILGVQNFSDENDDDSTPWQKAVSIHPGKNKITENIPNTIQATLSQRLFIEKKGLPSTLLNLIIRKAAFQNPEFYKKQNLRLSTALTPRMITCAEEHSQHLSLPRGCLKDIQNLLIEYDSQLKVEDLRIKGKLISTTFKGQLSETQKQAVNAILEHENGIVVAPPGFGKTVLGTYLVTERKCNTLILVHRQPLLQQWRSQLAVFLDLKANKIGQIGAGKRKISGEIDVAMIQSLSRKGVVDDIISEYGQIIIDECHHLSATSFERVLTEAKARYIVGLTATPQRRDGLQPIVQMQIGPIRFKVNPNFKKSENNFIFTLLVKKTNFVLPDSESVISIQEIYNLLANDKQRNEQIINDVLLSVESGRSPILLTERKDHLEYLHEKLKPFVRNIVVLKGGRSTKRQAEIQQQLESIPINEERLLLATGRFIGEGFDDARLDTLFLTLPVSWKGTLVQYAGRLHRSFPGKRDIQIFDYVDERIPMLAKMFNKRLRGYHSMGYQEKGEPDLFE